MDTRTDFQQRGGLVSSAAEELFSKMQLPWCLRCKLLQSWETKTFKSERGKHTRPNNYTKETQEATDALLKLQNEHFPGPLWRWTATMWALRDETVARATPGEFPANYPESDEKIWRTRPRNKWGIAPNASWRNSIQLVIKEIFAL